jgi:hypothetical protein
MAAYAYANWASQATAALQLSVLNQHIAEVSALMNGADVNADGKGINRFSLMQYHNNLLAERARMEANGAGVVNGGVVNLRMRAPT